MIMHVYRCIVHTEDGSTTEKKPTYMQIATDTFFASVHVHQQLICFDPNMQELEVIFILWGAVYNTKTLETSGWAKAKITV